MSCLSDCMFLSSDVPSRASGSPFAMLSELRVSEFNLPTCKLLDIALSICYWGMCAVLRLAFGLMVISSSSKVSFFWLIFFVTLTLIEKSDTLLCSREANS